MRLMVSRGVNQGCRLLFPHRLAGFADFASGMFLVRVKSVEPGRVYANGFKILRSPAVAHDWNHAEVAYAFGDRHAGISKAGWGEGLKFLRLVATLRLRNFRAALSPGYTPRHA